VGKKGGSTPDTVGAAREAGQQARWLAREQTIANRPNQYNPWGSTEWVRNPIEANPASSKWSSPAPQGLMSLGDKIRAGGSGKFGSIKTALNDAGSDSSGPPMYEWTQIEKLNPELQASLDAQFQQQRGRSELAASLLPQMQQEMGTPVNWDQYGDPIAFDPTQQRQMAEDAAYQRSVNRLDPQFAQQANELEISLRNKGLRPGDQAYDSAMSNFGQTRNDAYEQARLGATTEGRAETGLGMQTNEYANALRTQKIQEDLYKRGYTLEQINKLMQGQEIEGSSPSMSEKATIADQLSGAK